LGAALCTAEYLPRRARLALVGDRHQLPAVGRGGVLDLAYRWVHPDARVDLDAVHRFVHTVAGHPIPDSDYAVSKVAATAAYGSPSHSRWLAESRDHHGGSPGRDAVAAGSDAPGDTRLQQARADGPRMR
jgi:hypothetical protein